MQKAIPYHGLRVEAEFGLESLTVNVSPFLTLVVGWGKGICNIIRSLLCQMIMMFVGLNHDEEDYDRILEKDILPKDMLTMRTRATT